MALFFKKFLKDTSASVLPITALLIPVIFGVAGIGLDSGMWMMDQRNLQTAADAGAIAGAWEVARGGDDFIEVAALSEAISNGFNPNLAGQISYNYDPDDDSFYVTLSQESDLYLTKMFFSEAVRVSVEAKAQYIGVTDDFCILSLNEFAAGSLTTSGSVEVEMPDCGIAVNSSDDEALQINGNVTIDVDNVSIVGGYNISGGAADLITNSLTTGANPVSDPYADMDLPEVGACDYNNYRITGSGTKTLSPGVYCGGIRASGNNDIEFEPGVYIIDGGSIDISGGGTLSGEEVAFFLTGSGNDYAQLDITGNRDVEFTSPVDGDDMAGVVFYQDPDAPTNGNVSNNVKGTSDVIVDGAVYFPSQEINFGGNSSSVSDVCTKIIASYVVLHGNPFIGNDCSDTASEPIGVPVVKLIQ